MRSLEEEKRELALQLLELERTLYRTKEHYERQVESMKSENKKALLQTQLESEQLQSEYQVLQTEKAARIQELESELTALQERSASEVDTMQARVADLEQRNQGSCIQTVCYITIYTYIFYTHATMLECKQRV